MSQMLDMFKFKPYDLEALYSEWTDGPVFIGNSKKDLAVQAWLDKIREGCIERKVPEQCWHKVAQHFMGPMAKSRLEEVKKVMAQVQGEKYRWDWRKFKIAMTSMSWTIDSRKMAPVKIEKKSGHWWVSKTKEEREETAQEDDKKSDSWEWISKSKNQKEEPMQEEPAARPKPVRRQSVSSILLRRNTTPEIPAPPLPVRAATAQTIQPVQSNTMKKLPRLPMRSNTVVTADEVSLISSPALKAPDLASLETVTTITEVPAWLLNACGALDLLTTEHPKVMTALSAILITVGSIPALPILAGGAGGAIMASGAVHAAGAVAVAVGTMIKATQDSKQRSLLKAAADAETQSSK